jgi:AmmeMemoRadiSam system protein B
MILPKLRPDLQMMPSPNPQQPGLFIRDQFKFSDAWLIVPPALTSTLNFFDGVRTDGDLQLEFGRITGQADTPAAQQLFEALDKSGFLQNDTFFQLRNQRMKAFAESPLRVPVHAGSGYPNEADPLRGVLQGYLDGVVATPQPRMLGIAAPHVSPGGGPTSYGAAYRTLTPELRDRTFIILGTSHYGPPNHFGLTRKPFVTPYGTTGTDSALLDQLASQPAVIMEDYCHAIEHTIEFQVIFLQHLYGPNVKILPILCGPFFPSIYQNGYPEDDDAVRRFFDTLGSLAANNADRVFWVLGVDMAHIGARYGDNFIALAEQEQMLEVRQRDHQRIASITSGNAHLFWDQVKENHDDLRWCGSAPFYSFLKMVPQARGTLQHYEQWNIDPMSVVSFAGMSFTGT